MKKHTLLIFLSALLFITGTILAFYQNAYAMASSLCLICLLLGIFFLRMSLKKATDKYEALLISQSKHGFISLGMITLSLLLQMAIRLVNISENLHDATFYIAMCFLMTGLIYQIDGSVRNIKSKKDNNNFDEN